MDDRARNEHIGIAWEAWKERERAYLKHNPAGNCMETKGWNDPAWLPVLVEEVGEVARVLCDYNNSHTWLEITDQAQSRLREELIQVIAMATVWVARIDYYDAS